MPPLSLIPMLNWVSSPCSTESHSQDKARNSVPFVYIHNNSILVRSWPISGVAKWMQMKGEVWEQGCKYLSSLVLRCEWSRTCLPQIAGVEVLRVTRRGPTAVHFLPAPLETGATVDMEVDWQRRFDHMQQHSGKYFSLIIHTHYIDL